MRWVSLLVVRIDMHSATHDVRALSAHRPLLVPLRWALSLRDYDLICTASVACCCQGDQPICWWEGKNPRFLYSSRTQTRLLRPGPKLYLHDHDQHPSSIYRRIRFVPLIFISSFVIAHMLQTTLKQHRAVAKEKPPATGRNLRLRAGTFEDLHPDHTTESEQRRE